MRPFNERLRISNENRKEVQRYLNCAEVLTEDTILKIVRKLKQLEVKINENKYNR